MDQLDKTILAIISAVVAVLVIIISIAVHLEGVEEKKWTAFKDEYNCQLVDSRKGGLSTVTGVSVSPVTGGIGYVTGVSKDPDQYGWKCDDGAVYWNKYKPQI